MRYLVLCAVLFISGCNQELQHVETHKDSTEVIDLKQDLSDLEFRRADEERRCGEEIRNLEEGLENLQDGLDDTMDERDFHYLLNHNILAAIRDNRSIEDAIKDVIDGYDGKIMNPVMSAEGMLGQYYGIKYKKKWKD